MAGGWTARRRLAVAVGSAAVGALVGVSLSLAVSPTYEAQAVVALRPIDPASIYAPDEVPGPEVAVVRQRELASGEVVRDAIDDQVPGQVDVRVEVVGVDRLGFLARAGSADEAVATAATAGVVYAAVRGALAQDRLGELQADADAALTAAEAELAAAEQAQSEADGEDEEQVAEAAVDEASEAVARSQAEVDAVAEDAEAIAAGTAYLIGDPVRPSSPVSPNRLRWGAVGVVAGLLVGLVAGMVLAWRGRGQPDTFDGTRAAAALEQSAEV